MIRVVLMLVFGVIFLGIDTRQPMGMADATHAPLVDLAACQWHAVRTDRPDSSQHCHDGPIAMASARHVLPEDCCGSCQGASTCDEPCVAHALPPASHATPLGVTLANCEAGGSRSARFSFLSLEAGLRPPIA